LAIASALTPRVNACSYLSWARALSLVKPRIDDCAAAGDAPVISAAAITAVASEARAIDGFRIESPLLPPLAGPLGQPAARR
jgi:hypothetical protein